MRTLVLVIAAVMSLAALAIAVPGHAAAATPGIAKLSITIEGETVGTTFQFSVQAILLPQVPIVLNVTFLNNESAGSSIGHSFTIADSTGAIRISAGKAPSYVQPQNSTSVEFTVNSLSNITYNNVSFTPQDPGNGTIEYYCIPHVSLGMVGFILLGGSVPTTSPEKGIVIRAYWIGIIAFVAMLIWVGISYYVIKSSSPRFRDNRDHLRKGLP